MVTKFYPYDSLNDSFGVLMMDDPDNLTWMLKTFLKPTTT